MSEAESQRRRHLSAEQKVAILKRYLVEKAPISDLCDEYGIQPSQVYRVLKGAGRMGRFAGKPSRKGKGFTQPLRPHEHWHIDISHLNLCGMTHVRTSPYYPQSNGKKERWYQTLKTECLRRDTPLSLEDAQRIVALYVEHYNHVRLHSALGYIAPADKLTGREQEIFPARDRKLEEARARRKARRAAEPPRGYPAGMDFAALRGQLSMEQVLRRLGHWDCLRGSGAQRRGPCLVHGSTHAGSRSFSVNLPKNVFRCFCSGCGAKGNVLDLWAAVHQLPLAEAAKHLAQTFALDLSAGIREEEPVSPCLAPLASCLPTATAP